MSGSRAARRRRSPRAVRRKGRAAAVSWHGLRRAHLDYDRAVTLHEQRVALTPNNAAAHKALGRAYVEQGREDSRVRGARHRAAARSARRRNADDARSAAPGGRPHPAGVAALERALALDTSNSQALHALGERADPCRPDGGRTAAPRGVRPPAGAGRRGTAEPADRGDADGAGRAPHVEGRVRRGDRPLEAGDLRSGATAWVPSGSPTR